MRILIVLSLPLFLSMAEIQKCVDDYNAAVTERNNGTGAFGIAQNYKIRADSKAEAPNRAKLLEDAQTSALSAIEILERSEVILKRIRKECVPSIVEKADIISQKNKEDIATYDLYRREIKQILDFPK